MFDVTAGRPMHTFSIVARDPVTGEMGVAVQSHWFSVGALCPWAEAGVGAIATQAFVNVAFGPHGLAMLREGRTANEVVEALIAADEGREVRQLAVVDAQGNVAAHTGGKCVPDAGHLVGEHRRAGDEQDKPDADRQKPGLCDSVPSTQG